MITNQIYRDISWTDLESPSVEEVKKITQEHGITELVSAELFIPSLKPKVDLYRDYIYLVLHFPAIRHSHNGSQTDQEIDFIIGKKFLITTHYDTIDPLHEFSKIFEVNSILDRSDFGSHAGYIFYYMLKHIYKAMSNELDSIRDKLAFIEANTFSGHEKDMVEEISSVSRSLIDIKRALRPHSEILNSLEVAGLKFFGHEFDYHLRTIKDEFFRVQSELGSHSELLAEIRDTNNSLLSIKQNQTMQILSVIAFIALPVGMITALFQINTTDNPIVGMNFDFWIIFGIQIALALMLYIFVRFKKWL